VNMRIDAAGHDEHAARIDNIAGAATERTNRYDLPAGNGDISLGHVLRRDDRAAAYEQIVIHGLFPPSCFAIPAAI
jgi:hypothetical protein